MGAFNINGTELKLDLADIDTMAAFEQCMKEVAEKVQDKTQYEGKTNAEGLKYQCRLVEDAFNKLCGDGTADKIFAGKENNILAHMEAFAALAQEGQKAAQNIKALSVLPMMPAPNRKQRRAGGKKKAKKKKAKGKKT